MDRKLYAFGIFFFALYILTAAFQCFFQFRLGPGFFLLKGYSPWIMLTSLVYIVSFSTLLQYYHHQGYRLSFVTGVITLGATIGLHCLIYNIVYLDGLADLYFSCYAVVLVTGLIHSLTLLFSNSQQRSLLRIAGSISTLLGIVLLLLLIFFLETDDTGVKTSVEKIHGWVSLGNVLVSVIFMLNFQRERRWAVDNIPKQNKPLQYLMVLTGIAGLTLSIVLGLQLFRQSQHMEGNSFLQQQEPTSCSDPLRCGRESS